MVLPELSLLAGGKGSLGGRPCQFVVPERKVFENQFDFSRVFLKQLLEYGDKPRAVRSLEIVENSDGHLGVGWSFERRSPVIQLVKHGKGQNLQFLLARAAEQ